MDCCEQVANGYMDCVKCHENKTKELENVLYKKLINGNKMTTNEIKMLKYIVKNG